MNKKRQLFIFQRADFWILVYITILLLSDVFWNKTSIDIQVYTTYYVIWYSSFAVPTIGYLALITLIYWFFYLRSELNPTMTFLHLTFTIIPLTYMLWVLFVTQIGVAGWNNRYYSYSSGTMDSIYLFLVMAASFILGQLIFVVNVASAKKN